MRASMRPGWIAALLTAALVSTAGLISAGPATSGTMFFLNGTDPIPLIPPPVKSQSWMAALFSGTYANDTLINVDYPASVWPLTFDRPTMGRSIEIGATTTLGLLDKTEGEKTVVGISQGALVVDRLAKQLANDPEGGPIGQLTFVAVADPNRPGGIFTLLPPHTHLPILNITNDQPADSPYDTIAIVQQYDAVGDFPDRPWNLISVANAFMGLVYYHLDPDWYLHVEIPSTGGVSATNSLDGTTTTYLIPSPHLPLTQPLRDVGVPADFVDKLDNTLRPAVDAGYSRLTPDAGPHIEYGRLVWPDPPDGRRAVPALRSNRGDKPTRTVAAQRLKPVTSQSRSASPTPMGSGSGSVQFGRGRGHLTTPPNSRRDDRGLDALGGRQLRSVRSLA
jgi:hypothetical protein